MIYTTVLLIEAITYGVDCCVNRLYWVRYRAAYSYFFRLDGGD